ncbi:hypothetical protein CMT52_17450 [Elizabethkingia anophelis]|nr:hypothetical protein [Elizabethkingia anophelis]
MRRNLHYFPFYGVLLLLSLSSCRSENDFRELKQSVTAENRPLFRIFTEEQQNNLKKNLQATVTKFNINNPSLSKTDYYALSFRKLYYDYFEYNNIPLPSENDPQLDFRFHSTLLEFENEDKAMIFPVIQSGRVESLRMAILEQKGTFIRYDYLDENYPNYKEIKAIFTEQYLKSGLKLNNLNARISKKLNLIAGTDCIKNPFDYDCTIEPVIVPGKPKPPPVDPLPWINPYPPVIIPYPTPTPNPPTAPAPDPPFPGGCKVFNNCTKDKGDKTDEKDNCSQLKTVTTDEKFKSKVETLKGKLGEKDEYGYMRKYDSTDFDEITRKSESKDQGGYKTKSLNVLVTDIPKMQGYIHTHPIAPEDSENKDIPIFSPGDIKMFMEMVNEAQKQGKPLNETYATVVSRLGTYTLKFTGDKNVLDEVYKKVNKLQNNTYVKKMIDIVNSEDPKDFESAFLDYLRYNVANDGGIALYKNETDGTNSRVQYKDVRNGDGIDYQKCPE